VVTCAFLAGVCTLTISHGLPDLIR
jgi:hypothetical protein